MTDADLPGGPDGVEPGADDVDEIEEAAALRCRACGTVLADPSDVFPGSRTLQVNPHGFLHELVTVREARNLILAGRPTDEATWFAGYAWDLAFCAGCRAHVGWEYTGGRSPPRFYGLRTAAITGATPR